jgi:P27 family predicted phage terminase small subunit
MSKAAKREWAYIVPKLAKLRIVTELDRAVLESYCSAYGRWRETEEVLKDEPSILRVVTERAEDGTALKSYVTQNPLLAVANRARKQMHEALAELGLSPSSRTRVMTMDRGSADDPFGIL